MSTIYVIDQYAKMLFPDIKMQFTSGDRAKKISNFALKIHPQRSQAAILLSKDLMSPGEELDPCNPLPDTYYLVVDPKDLGDKKINKAKLLADDFECRKAALQELRNNVADNKLPTNGAVGECECMLGRIDAAIAGLDTSKQNITNNNFYQSVDYDASLQRLVITQGKDTTIAEINGITPGYAEEIFAFNSRRDQPKRAQKTYVTQPKIEKVNGNTKITIKRLTYLLVQTFELVVSPTNMLLSTKKTVNLALDGTPQTTQEQNEREYTRQYFTRGTTLQLQATPNLGYDIMMNIPGTNAGRELAPDIDGVSASRNMLIYINVFLKSGPRYVGNIEYRTRYFECGEFKVGKKERVGTYFDNITENYKNGAKGVNNNSGTQDEKTTFLFRNSVNVYADNADEAQPFVRDIDARIDEIERVLTSDMQLIYQTFVEHKEL